jgi:hypothetical protein
MSVALSTRTVCCKLAVDAADVALRQTQAAFNAAASYCASVAWQQGVTNKNKLHHIVYGPTRVNFGLGAQLACCARDKAAEAVRSARSNGHSTCPTFDADSSIRYDARTYRLESRFDASSGTQRVPSTIPGHFGNCERLSATRHSLLACAWSTLRRATPAESVRCVAFVIKVTGRLKPTFVASRAAILLVPGTLWVTNAAVNIAGVAAVNQPIVSLLSHSIERADPSCAVLTAAVC